jgi:hypothetical protein
MFICRIAITAGDSITGISGTAPFCNTTAFSANPFGAFTSPTLEFNPGTDGGAAALRVCADTDSNSVLSAGDACGAVVYVYFAQDLTLGVTPSSIINGATHVSTGSCSTTDYRPDCPGATPASDATLTGTFMIQNLAGAPAPAPLRLIYRIVDSLPPTPPGPNYINVSSVSWTACSVPVNTTTNPPPVDGTDELAVTQTMSFGTTTISRDLWVCGPGSTADPQLTVYWLSLIHI